MVNGKAGFALHDLGDSEKKVKNFYIVSVLANWRRMV